MKNDTPKVKFRVTGPRFAVKLMERPEKSDGGLFLPDATEYGELRGQVVAVGDGYLEAGQRIPLPISVGEWVLAPPTAARRAFSVEGERFVLMSENEIFCVLDEAPKPTSNIDIISPVVVTGRPMA